MDNRPIPFTEIRNTRGEILNSRVYYYIKDALDNAVDLDMKKAMLIVLPSFMNVLSACKPGYKEILYEMTVNFQLNEISPKELMLLFENTYAWDVNAFYGEL